MKITFKKVKVKVNSVLLKVKKKWKFCCQNEYDLNEKKEEVRNMLSIGFL